MPVTGRVHLAGPLDLGASLESFRRWGDDLLDRWDGRDLLRTTIAGSERVVGYACRPAGSIADPAVELEVGAPADWAPAVEAVARLAVLPPPEYGQLLRRDRVLGRLERSQPGVRPIVQEDLLTALVRCISAQQVNLRWATTVRRRLAERYGTPHAVGPATVWRLSAPRLAAATITELRSIQLTTRKAETVVTVAGEVASGRLSDAELSRLPDAEVHRRLTALRGIGGWSADWILARHLGRPRVVAGDLGIRKAVGLAYLGVSVADEPAVRAATAHWGEAAAVAQAVLLNALAVGALARRATR